MLPDEALYVKYLQTFNTIKRKRGGFITFFKIFNTSRKLFDQIQGKNWHVSAYLTVFNNSKETLGISIAKCLFEKQKWFQQT